MILATTYVVPESVGLAVLASATALIVALWRWWVGRDRRNEDRIRELTESNRTDMRAALKAVSKNTAALEALNRRDGDDP